MKMLLHTLTITFCGLSAIHAEGPVAPPPPGKGPGGGGEMRMRMKNRFLENLPPEARQRFEAARSQALQDPKIQELRAGAEEANREFFQAMRKKMLEIDPGLKEIVEQQAREGRRTKENMKEGRRDGGGRDAGFANLTDAEKEKLLAAREKAKADPAVQAAAKAKEEAATPEARRAAGDEFRKAMHLAVLKADPSLGPVLEKLAPKPPPSGPVPGGDGEMMNPPQ
jgi:hypothetical protein